MVSLIGGALFPTQRWGPIEKGVLISLCPYGFQKIKISARLPFRRERRSEMALGSSLRGSVDQK